MNQQTTYLYTEAQIRAAEKTFRPRGGASLMLRAGEAVAKQTIVMLKTRKAKTVLILAGPGNNGGDAWVAARALQLKKIKVAVCMLGEQKFADPTAKKARDAFLNARGTAYAANARNPSTGAAFGAYGLIVDGIFGIGFSAAKRGLSGEFLAATQAANSASEEFGVPILAIDVASGLDAETGAAATDAIRANTTITFLGAKPGLYTADGVDCSGNVIVDALGVLMSGSMAKTANETSGELLTREMAAALVPMRRNNSHKGSYGNAGIIGGAEGMVGAAVLAARAALHVGPGKVYVGLAAKNAMSVDAINPEIMVRDAKSLANDKTLTALAIGMGLGESKSCLKILRDALSLGVPTLLDADALNILSANPRIGGQFQAKMAGNSRKYWGLILTPHPGEAARLLKTTTAKVQSARVESAQKIAKKWNSVVVLKGAGTVIATPDGKYVINTSGNPGMASGGMGDALSGMIVGLMAQGLSTWNAAKLGVYLHGASADAALHHGMGPLGLTASEVIFEARTMLNSQLEDHHD
jgi:ADP-dependent NAD(P)H-hydrate dehydratase / NAD(P)H-hydrate epimerase